MHLIVGDSQNLDGASNAVVINQTPADWLFLSFADTDLTLLALAMKRGNPLPSLRAANLAQMKHPFTIDDYIDKTAQHAKVIIIRLLGGKNYWAYGVEQFHKIAKQRNIQLYFLNGDGGADPELTDYTTGDAATRGLLETYWQKGGVENVAASLQLLSGETTLPPPRDILPAGLYAPNQAYDFAMWQVEKPAVVIMFYRAHFQSGQLSLFDKLLQGLKDNGISAVGIYVSGGKDQGAKKIIEHLFAKHQPKIILSFLNFAIANHMTGEVTASDDTIALNAWGLPCPMLQPLLSSTPKKTWQKNPQGLSVQDATLSVILPEQDGVIVDGIIGFKESARRHKQLETELKDFALAKESLSPLIKKLQCYLQLQTIDNHDKKLVVVTSNYPAKDSRLMNGVGLNTPESVAQFFIALYKKKYDMGKAYQPRTTGNDIVGSLLAGVTNNYPADKKNGVVKKICLTLSLADYKKYFAQLSKPWQKKITAQWGAPQDDPFFDKGRKAFLIMGEQFGKVTLLLQPQRGYDIDPDATQHDPQLAPPHYYIAHYCFVNNIAPHAMVHFGKHGNLEWLPGKSLGGLNGVQSSCLPRALLPACPYFYPFIINDPGEGAQAKRRTSSAIIAHLPPMMMRAEQSASLQKLEWLMDEYNQARQLNEPRQKNIITAISDELTNTGLDKELGIDAKQWRDDGGLQQLAVIDRHLCDLRDLQIRGGLHVFGGKIERAQLAENIFYLLRVKTDIAPLGDVIADVLEKNNDQEPAHKKLLEQVFGKKITTAGDWQSAIDQLAILWLGDILSLPAAKNQQQKIKTLQPIFLLLKKSPAIKPLIMRAELLLAKILSSPKNEMNNLLRGLDGGFIPPGGSGAPSRGRPDLLPTGHNFFTVDNRKTPSPSAYDVARRSSELVLARYIAEHGDYPKTITLTAWGTAEMRTAGETIATALCLLGVTPNWEAATGRVTGFTIQPLSLLNRPRVMVNLRISGFFRDAFPHLINLFDGAHRAVAALPEPPAQNPIAHHYRETIAQLITGGVAEDVAGDLAGASIFGPAPGSYGTGMQQMLDNSTWRDTADLAQQFLQWTSHYYGKNQSANNVAVTPNHGGKKNIFHDKLAMTDVVMQNQDNREHDILDSDDYYQFQGGLFNAASFLQQGKGIDKKLAHYHNDHSNPQQPVVRSLSEEIGLILRGRAVNQKWLARIRQTGYKGGFEMAATVDYLFAFAATTHAVRPEHFDLLFQHYLLDKSSVDFLRANNAPALYDMAEKFDEAITRGLWQPKRNDTLNILESFLLEKNKKIH
ncbi:MAG: cobaltochelatase subunit CobN [Hydrotalea sp.]|nr:cobaltochelatase subunit CobN [Hydrotalea sp.]